MDRTRHGVIFIVVYLSLDEGCLLVRAQYPGGDVGGGSGDKVSNFQPSLAVVIGVLFILFSATFILLMYAKFYYRGGWEANGGRSAAEGGGGRGSNNIFSRSRRFSGIDKTVIESLPFFRFSSLRGSRTGLECSVCLSKFEDVEILRLLPKCKHAFHIGCIDHWLERHSTCPLCRSRVSPDDPDIFAYSNSMRLLTSSNRHSQRIDVQDSNSFGIFIEREEDDEMSPSSIGIGSSFRKLFNGSTNNSNISSSNGGKDEESLLFIQEVGKKQKVLHRFNHRVVVSDVMFQHRWSNVSSSDLTFLNSEMLTALSSDRFSAADLLEESDMDGNGDVHHDRKWVLESKLIMKPISKIGQISSGPSTANGPKKAPEVEKRSQSEITAVSRFGMYSTRGWNRKEERRRKLWLPIARRTVQWIAKRESRRPPSPNINTGAGQTHGSAPV
ncbi:hypothetical protein SAY86_009582 [Trapa natans]|uniref:RING-type E3 ubiquitin transferase n=1 Tax=Trapa natans TaxID=22666 RepID=A0AAN7QQC1_TRANT|nr:hypothetical protein SAY86_009582 [Trapa natans]